MSFTTPLALAWLGLAIPIVIFYILKIRLRRVPVSTNLFWRQIFDEKQPRSLWQQLRHWLSLLAQLLLLILLVLALCDPYFSWEVFQAQRLVLVLDNSASMNASDVEPTRLAKAKQLGTRTIARLRMRDEMAILAAGTEPQVVCGMTGHQRTLREKLEQIPSTDGPTKVADAIVLARRLIGDHPRGRIVVLTDGCFAGADTAVTKDTGVEVQLVGTRTGNVGITRWQARRSLIDPLGYEILGEVLNASDEIVECRLEIDLDDRAVDVIPLKLQPGEIWKQTLEKTTASGGRLTAKLKHSDALDADNTAWALLPKRDTKKVVLVTAGNHFLSKALEANQLVELTVRKDFPDVYDPQAIYFFHRRTPDKLPAVPTFVIDPSNDCDQWTLGEKLSNPIVAKQDQDSELMRHVRLDNVLMPDARQLKPVEPIQVLVQSLSGDPLFAAIERQGAKALVLTVNLDEGDLTFRTAFPIMVTNALAWFSGQTGELRESVAAGNTAEIELPYHDSDASRWWKLKGPADVERRVAQNVAKTTIGPLDRCGIWTLTEADAKASPESIEIACNLASREESDVRVPQTFAAQPAHASIGSAIFVRPIWFYLIVLAWVVITAEWCLYQRRWLG